MKKIIFYNRAHYGDLFVSRSFIKDICTLKLYLFFKFWKT